jgi:hypothetical protein
MTPTEELIQEAKRQGFDIYAPPDLTTYFYVSKGEKIGYCQWDTFTSGPVFSTVHKPNRHSGTGYRVETMAQTLANRPHWANTGDTVNKYKSTADFLAKHWQKLIRY